MTPTLAAGAYSVGFPQSAPEPARLGERRDVWESLEHLTPIQRINLLRDCCKYATRGKPYVLPDTMGTQQQTYDDLSLLVVMHGASWDKIATCAYAHAIGRI